MGKWECDDGNIYNGDGCSSNCIIEYGYSCSGGSFYSPDSCEEKCGDGINLATYANICDDYNTAPDDGCSSTCRVEVGWTCAGGTAALPDTCTEIQHDGMNFKQYWCDDGNAVNGDGCDSNSDVEPGWTCFGGNSTTADFCWQPHPRITSMTLSDNNTVVEMTFNETTFMKWGFTKDDFLVYVTGPRDYYSFSFEWLNYNYYQGTGISFTTQLLQINYNQFGQFFGLNSEAIVVGVRDGQNFENLRYGTLIQNSFVLFANPRESDYKCEMDEVWTYSFYCICIFFGVNFLAYFIDMSMNYFWSLCYFLQIVGLLPLI